MNHEHSLLNPYLISCGFLNINDCPPPETLFPLRIVRWYELELIHQSNSGYVVSRDHRIEAKKGVLMIRKPGTVVQGVSAYECNSIIFDSQFDPNLMRFYKENMYQNPTTELLMTLKDKRLDFLEHLPDYIDVMDYLYFKELFEEAMHLFLKQGDDFQLRGKQIILMLLGAILNEIHNKDYRDLKKQNPNAYEAMSLTKQFMDTTYKESITLNQLAHRTGYSKEAYCRMFKKTFGKSPIDYLIDVRLFHAKKLLMTTNNSIYEIAMACGFNNDTYFYTLFKKKEGLSPTRYRQSNRWV